MYAFIEIFNHSESNNVFCKIYNCSEPGYVHETLVSKFSMSYNQLKDLDVDIEYALANNLIEQVNYVEFTNEELRLIVECLVNIQNNDICLLNKPKLDSLKIVSKLKEYL